jgi:hypothetical protein
VRQSADNSASNMAISRPGFILSSYAMDAALVLVGLSYGHDAAVVWTNQESGIGLVGRRDDSRADPMTPGIPAVLSLTLASRINQLCGGGESMGS